jgi:hypothetical protein
MTGQHDGRNRSPDMTIAAHGAGEITGAGSNVFGK